MQCQGLNCLVNDAQIQIIIFFNSPRVGLEPTTDRLTADCSTTELSGIIKLIVR